MMNQMLPLRYKISSWRQLPDCRSNNDRELRIHVVDYFNNLELRGFRISVDHPRFGTLFACVLEARGRLITDIDEYGRSELSSEAILGELKKYGFYITYVPNENLPSETLEYLITLDKLGYDKIRIIDVWEASASTGVKNFKPMIVAFQVKPLGDWLNNAYSPSLKEFTQALTDGTAINLTDISKTKQLRWDWLKGYVLNIKDIIRDNADDMIRFTDPNAYVDDVDIDTDYDWDSSVLPQPESIEEFDDIDDEDDEDDVDGD